MIEIIVRLGAATDTAWAETAEAAVYAARTLMREQAVNAGRGVKPVCWFAGANGPIAGPLTLNDLLAAGA